jgi:hypothetical protein
MADQAASKAFSGNPRGRTINIRVSENVTLENLSSIIGRIGGLYGCPACGLLGVDLRLTGDPVEAQQIQKLPGVQSVSFGA